MSSMTTFADVPTLADYLANGSWPWRGEQPHHWPTDTVTVSITGLNAAEQSLAQSALNAWRDVANINFTFTTGAAQITFDHDGTGTADMPATWNPSGAMTSATIDISTDWAGDDFGLDSYKYYTYIHEIGHALGLGHQGPYNGSATYGVDNIYTNDTWQYSVMSYFPQTNFGDATSRYVVTPQVADIDAVQSIYGHPQTSTRTGDTVYGFNSDAGPVYNFANYASDQNLAFFM